MKHPKIDAVLCHLPTWRVIAVGYMAFIFWSSHQRWEGAQRRLPVDIGDLLHFPIYAIMACFIALAFGAWTASNRRSPFWLGFIGAITFGFGDEIHQDFVVGRSCSIFDVVVDGCGAAFAMIVLRAMGEEAWSSRTWRLAGMFLGLGVFVALFASDWAPGFDRWLSRSP